MRFLRLEAILIAMTALLGVGGQRLLAANERQALVDLHTVCGAWPTINASSTTNNDPCANTWPGVSCVTDGATFHVRYGMEPRTSPPGQGCGVCPVGSCFLFAGHKVSFT